MRKILFAVFLAGICISGCKKDNNPPPAPVVLSDSLGAGWQRIKIDSTLFLSDVFFVNAKTGFVCGKNYIGKSTDGGLTWTNVTPSNPASYINAYFLNEQLGWITGQTVTLRTKDGGASWEQASINGIFDVQFFNADTGYVVPKTVSGGGKTADGLKTIIPFPSPVVFDPNGPAALCFLNQNNGWIQSGKYNYRTRDGGQSFEQLPYIFPRPAYTMQFVDSLHGWSAGFGCVYATTDGGKQYTTIFQVDNTDLGGDIAFFDANNGYILAQDNIYATSDGGKTKTSICAVHKAKLEEIHFTDPSHGWAVGGAGFLYRYVKP